MSCARVCAFLGSAWALVPASAAGQGIQIVHDGVGCVVAGKFPRLEARIEPAASVGRARVHFRAEGSAAWYFVEMKAIVDAWVGVLPKPNATLTRFSYYLEVTGTRFEESRTAEYAPRVVKARAECEARTLVAAVSAIGPTLIGAPLGGPAMPAGFVSLSPAGATASGVGTAAASGGGSSTGLVLGVVGGALAVGGGVVALTRGGDSGAASAAVAPGGTGGGVAGGGSGTRTPQSLILSLSNNCTLYGGVAVYAGDKVDIGRGMCSWNTPAEAQAACAGQTATLTVDGALLPAVRYSIGYDGGNGFICASADADWTAVAGRHVAAGIWTIPGSPLNSCTMDVQP